MYPFEWIAAEVQKDELLAEDLAEIDTLEPAWKLIIGNKAILPLLWKMFPNHPNLLPAHFDDAGIENLLDGEWISKPKFGREGHGVLFSSDYNKMDLYGR